VTPLLVALLLGAAPGEALALAPVESPAALPAQGDATGRLVAFVATSTALSAVATGLGVGAGVWLHSVPFDVTGRPNPWVTTGALAVALGLNAALTHLAVPWVAGALRWSSDAARVREVTWQSARWALAGGAVGALTFAVGAGLEQSSFGRGQSVMLVGVVLGVLSLFAWDVVEAVAAWVGAAP
jgi:hypothetical protein